MSGGQSSFGRFVGDPARSSRSTKHASTTRLLAMITSTRRVIGERRRCAGFQIDRMHKLAVMTSLADHDHPRSEPDP